MQNLIVGKAVNCMIKQSSNIIDPKPKAPTVNNPFLHPRPHILLVDKMALDRLLATGMVFGAWNVALLVQSKRLASNAGMTADDAAKEWAANVVPGITFIPSRHSFGDHTLVSDD